MSVTLAKTPRDYLVLVQDGEVLTAQLTPTDGAEYEELCVNAFVHCLEVHQVTATDRYAAHTAVAATMASDNDWEESAALLEDVEAELEIESIAGYLHGQAAGARAFGADDTMATRARFTQL